MKKSQTEAPLTIIGAMGKADEILGSNRKWKHANRKQKLFIKELFEPCRFDVKKIKEIESIASGSAAEINDFLRKRGSGATTEPFARDEIGIASIMDILVEWIKKGSNVEIETPEKKKYKGVRIGEKGVRFYRSNDHNHPIASLATKTEDQIFMTMLDEEEAKCKPGEFMLHKKIERIMRDVDGCFDYGGIKFPKADLDRAEDMNWLLGINTISSKKDSAVIKYAYQKNRLRMNEFGARAQSEFAGMIFFRATARKQKPDHLINKPFLCWIVKEGFKKPLFAAYIAEEDWKDPGDIRKSKK
ncbi:MAG: hypothetical protein WA063_02790 [Minisyncoccia bacterium]